MRVPEGAGWLCGLPVGIAGRQLPGLVSDGCQALFDMGPVEKGLFCLVARSVPMGVQSVRDTSPCVGGCPLGIEGPLLPPSSQL